MQKLHLCKVVVGLIVLEGRIAVDEQPLGVAQLGVVGHLRQTGRGEREVSLWSDIVEQYVYMFENNRTICAQSRDGERRGERTFFSRFGEHR
jgi:hypothetical protein